AFRILVDQDPDPRRFKDVALFEEYFVFQTATAIGAADGRRILIIPAAVRVAVASAIKPAIHGNAAKDGQRLATNNGRSPVLRAFIYAQGLHVRPDQACLNPGRISAAVVIAAGSP